MQSKAKSNELKYSNGGDYWTLEAQLRGEDL